MWSARRLHVALSMQRLVLVETSKLRPGKLIDYDTISCTEAADAEPWRPAVNALTHLLADRQSEKATLHIVLSGRFVRWQLLPWRSELTRQRELAAYASLTFRETFGSAAADWRIVQPLQSPQQAVPACAIDTALLAALHRSCEEAGAHLAAVTPYFSSVFDHWRNTFKGKTIWFGVIEADCLSLGLIQNNSWLGLRSQRLDQDWRDILPGMMAQIGIQAGLDDAASQIYLAAEPKPSRSDETGAFVWLQPQARATFDEVGCRMALGI